MSEGASLGGPSAALVALIAATVRDVAAEAELLNRLDGVAGDGDLGVTVTRAAEAIEGVAAEAAAMEPGPALRRIGRAIAAGAPSSGGTLVAFALMAAGAADDPSGTPAARVAAALDAARRSIAERGQVGPGDRTMLDAIGPAADAAADAAAAGSPLGTLARAAADAADAGARATEGMEPVVGRAGWLKDRARGHEDAGARLAALLVAAAARRVEDPSA